MRLPNRLLPHAVACFIAIAALPVTAYGQDSGSNQAAELFQQGQQALSNQQFAPAVKAFDAAIAMNPSDASYYYFAGLAHQSYAYLVGTGGEHRKELREAVTLFGKAVELRSDYFDALIHMANIQSELQDYDASLKNLQTALAISGITAEEKAHTQQAIAYVSGQIQKNGSSPATVSQTTTPTAGQSPAQDANESSAAESSDEPMAVTPMQEPAVAQREPVGGGMPYWGWTTFTDPSEHSFELEVPKGWKAEGGLTRASAIDCRPWVRVTSPDNLHCAFIGDGAISPATMPTATLSSLGFRPGRTYNGTQVLSYIPARRFVEKYAFLKLKPIISNLAVESEGNHPDIALAVNGTVGATRSECASIKITGNYGSVPASGYYIAATKATVQSGTGMWWVTYIAGNIGPAERDEFGLGILLHMIGTFHMDPAWQERAHQTTAAVSANYRATANAISNSIVNRYWSQQAANERFNQAYWDRQAVQDHAANNFSDYIRGQQTVVDPQSGQQYKVEQANEHWIDPAGNITGTTGGAPGPEWHRLDNVP